MDIILNERNAIGRKVIIPNSRSLFFNQKGTILLFQEAKVARILGFKVALAAIFTIALEGGVTTEFKNTDFEILGSV